jgi:hypothetical protein
MRRRTMRMRTRRNMMMRMIMNMIPSIGPMMRQMSIVIIGLLPEAAGANAMPKGPLLMDVLLMVRITIGGIECQWTPGSYMHGSASKVYIHPELQAAQLIQVEWI